MSKVFIVQDDALYFNSSEFNVLFHHIDFFKPYEIEHYDECFTNHGMEGIDLSFVSKKTFNIFCLRFFKIFNVFTTNHQQIQRTNLYEESNEDYLYFSNNFKLIINN